MATTDPTNKSKKQSAHKDKSTETLPKKEHHHSSFWIGLLVIALFVGANKWSEHRDFGQSLQFAAYDLLHARLPQFDKAPLPVTIVDISELSGGNKAPTDYKALAKVIEPIADQEPAAIAVDIDFSPMANSRPDYSGPNARDVEVFLQFCRGITKGTRTDGRSAAPVPIFLGVGRTCTEAPSLWLGWSDYNDMACAIKVQSNDMRRMPRWITGPAYTEAASASKENTSQPPSTQPSPVLYSMAQCLADAYAKQQHRELPPPPGWVENMPVPPDRDGTSTTVTTKSSARVGGVVEEMPRPEPDGFQWGLSLINYSKLEELNRETVVVNVRNKVPVISGRFQGKMVIVGDAEIPDTFTVLGGGSVLRGALAHASAAYTFAANPLYELHPGLRFILDALLGLFLLIVLTIVEHLDDPQWQLRGHLVWEVLSIRPIVERLTEPQRKLCERWAHRIVLGVVPIGGLLLVRWYGIMWLDFLAIVLALWLHPYIDPYIEKPLTHFRKIFWPDHRETAQSALTTPSHGSASTNEGNKS